MDNDVYLPPKKTILWYKIRHYLTLPFVLLLIVPLSLFVQGVMAVVYKNKSLFNPKQTLVSAINCPIIR